MPELEIPQVDLFHVVGGMPFFERLVGRFYEGVAADPVLRALYPAGDLRPAARRLTLFLVQFWGGPTTYRAERGLPRLRSRHFAFRIGPDARDRWLACMRAAVDGCDPPAEARAEMLGYFEVAAEAMRNEDA